jgi:hypothetical protein
MITKSENYKTKFLSLKPTLLETFTNKLGQKVEFYEHPTNGDLSPVYCLINGILADTEFFETCDLNYLDSDYQPLLINDKIVCSFELD